LTECYIDYTPGSGGNFLRHFLEPKFLSSHANFWVDEEWSTIGGGNGNLEANPYTQEDCLKFGNRYPQIFTIGLGATNIKEFIKVHTLVNLKNMHRSINRIDDIITDIQCRSFNLFDISSVSVMINYENLFNLKLLKKLYVELHNAQVPNNKIAYYNSYKQKHDKIFASWQYNVIEKICLFEYNNNVAEFKIRNWSIDDITENNWRPFLDENLCLTNYS